MEVHRLPQRAIEREPMNRKVRGSIEQCCLSIEYVRMRGSHGRTVSRELWTLTNDRFSASRNGGGPWTQARVDEQLLTRAWFCDLIDS